MYQLYANDQRLWEPGMEDLQIYSPSLDLALNKAGSLTFNMPPTHLLYDQIEKLRTTIYVKDDGAIIWSGRVLHDTKNFYNQKEIYCEGALSFLIDTLVSPVSDEDTYTVSVAEYFKELIENHNQQAESNRQFVVGECNVTGDIEVQRSGYTDTMSELQSALLDQFQGYLKISYSTTGAMTLHYVSEFNEQTDQLVEFGVNLIDVEDNIDASDICTVLVATATTNDSQEEISYTYTNDATVSTYGKIYRHEDFGEVADSDELKGKCEEYFTKGNGKLANTLTIKAVDMSFIDHEYDRIELGDSVHVHSNPHLIDSFYKCNSINMPLDNLGQTEYTLGDEIYGFTDQQLRTQRTTSSLQIKAKATTEAITSTKRSSNQFYFSEAKLMIADDPYYKGHPVTNITLEEQKAIVTAIRFEYGADLGGSILVAQEIRDTFDYLNEPMAGHNVTQSWKHIIDAHHSAYGSLDYWLYSHTHNVDFSSKEYEIAYKAYQYVFVEGNSAIRRRIFAYMTPNYDMSNGGQLPWWIRCFRYQVGTYPTSIFWTCTLFDTYQGVNCWQPSSNAGGFSRTTLEYDGYYINPASEVNGSTLAPLTSGDITNATKMASSVDMSATGDDVVIGDWPRLTRQRTASGAIIGSGFVYGGFDPVTSGDDPRTYEEKVKFDGYFRTWEHIKISTFYPEYTTFTLIPPPGYYCWVTVITEEWNHITTYGTFGNTKPITATINPDYYYGFTFGCVDVEPTDPSWTYHPSQLPEVFHNADLVNQFKLTLSKTSDTALDSGEIASSSYLVGTNDNRYLDYIGVQNLWKTISGSFNSLSGGTSIDDNADLNDYTGLGNYYSASAITISNGPLTQNTAFTLTVESTIGVEDANAVRQYFKPAESSVTYTRYKSASGWSAWTTTSSGGAIASGEETNGSSESGSGSGSGSTEITGTFTYSSTSLSKEKDSGLTTTSFTVRVYRYGRLGVLDVYFVPGTLTAGAQYTMMTIPEGYRPRDGESMLFYDQEGHRYLIILQTTGEVLITPYGHTGSDVSVSQKIMYVIGSSDETNVLTLSTATIEKESDYSSAYLQMYAYGNVGLLSYSIDTSALTSTSMTLVGTATTNYLPSEACWVTVPDMNGNPCQLYIANNGKIYIRRTGSTSGRIMGAVPFMTTATSGISAAPALSSASVTKDSSFNATLFSVTAYKYDTVKILRMNIQPGTVTASTSITAGYVTSEYYPASAQSWHVADVSGNMWTIILNTYGTLLMVPVEHTGGSQLVAELLYIDGNTSIVTS